MGRLGPVLLRLIAIADDPGQEGQDVAFEAAGSSQDEAQEHEHDG
jgi:hypothetical protein